MKKYIRPIDNYIVSSLINLIDRACCDEAGILCVYYNTYCYKGIKKPFLNITIVVDESYEKGNYFSHIAKSLEEKTNLTISIALKMASEIKDDKISGHITFDRLNKYKEDLDEAGALVELEPPLDITKVSSWESNKPYLNLKLDNGDYQLMNNAANRIIDELTPHEQISGIYVVTRYYLSRFSYIITAVTETEKEADELRSIVTERNVKMFIKNLPASVILNFCSNEALNANFTENSENKRQINSLVNGNIVFDRYKELAELQKMYRSLAYRAYFQPYDSAIAFEPPLKLERLSNNN